MENVRPGPLIARGRTAEVYQWQEDRVLKLFYDWCPEHWANGEIENSRIVQQKNVSVPGVIDEVSIGSRRGIIYERVQGRSMLRLISSKPWLCASMARELADLHLEIHGNDGEGLPGLHESLRATILHVDCIQPDLKKEVLHRLDKLPEGNGLCHYDFHPDQVIFTGKGPVVIDWMTAHRGAPAADVARTLILFRFGEVPEIGPVMRLLVRLTRKLLYRAYLSRYLGSTSCVTEEEIGKWTIPVAAARLNEGIDREREPLQDYLRYQLGSQQR